MGRLSFQAEATADSDHAVWRLAIGSEAPATARVRGEAISSTRAMLPAGG